MPIGPIELLVIKFPVAQVRQELVPPLAELVEGGMIRIIDLAFVRKDADGVVTAMELSDLDDDTFAALDPLVADVSGLLSEEDLHLLASGLENGSSVGMMLFENTWATRFADAVRGVGGELVLNERIPRAVIDELIAAQASLAA